MLNYLVVGINLTQYYYPMTRGDRLTFMAVAQTVGLSARHDNNVEKMSVVYSVIFNCYNSMT